MYSATTVEYLDVFGLGVYRSKVHEYPKTKVTTQAGATTQEYGGEFASHFAKLDQIAVTPSLWPEGAEHPEGFALEWARIVLQQLSEDDLPPTRVVASAEGGIAICFVNGNKYADIECLNSGEILGVTSNRRDRPAVWIVPPDAGTVARASARIRQFLEASETRENGSRWPWRR